jgi:hypothetical protein
MSHMSEATHNGFGGANAPEEFPPHGRANGDETTGGIPRAVAKQIIKDAADLESRVAKMDRERAGAKTDAKPMTWEQYRADIQAKESAVLMRKREIAADRKLAALDREGAHLTSSNDYLRDQLDRVIAPQGDGWARVSREHVINDVLAEADRRSPIEAMLVAHILACSSGAMEMYELAAVADGPWSRREAVPHDGSTDRYGRPA